jgi:phosphoribosylanthranilate isomerase
LEELVCRGCNRHIFRVVPERSALCAHCQTFPAWYREPRVFRIFSGRDEMKLMHVTFTGADDSCRPEELLYLSRHYRFIEWGVLLSRNSMGSARFPSLGWINELQRTFKDTEHKLALHLCGSLLRELMVGEDYIPSELVNGFQRVQLNFHGEPLKFERDKCVRALSKAFGNRELIFQIDGAQGAEMLAAVEDGKQTFHCVPLFDVSHGSGVLPETWPTAHNSDGPFGYAGGLGPENLEEQLPRIENAAAGEPYWIDMETNVRSREDGGRTFDLHAVRACCDIVHRFVNPPAPSQEVAS